MPLNNHKVYLDAEAYRHRGNDYQAAVPTAFSNNGTIVSYGKDAMTTGTAENQLDHVSHLTEKQSNVLAGTKTFCPLARKLCQAESCLISRV